MNHIKTLTAAQSKLDNLKTYYNVKVELKKLRLEELKNDIDGKLNNRKSESKTSGSDNWAGTSSVAQLKSDNDVILIDDDDTDDNYNDSESE